MFRVIKRVSIYLFSMLVSLAPWHGEIGAFYNNTLTFSACYFHFNMGPYFVGRLSQITASNYKFNFKQDNVLSF